MNEYAAAIRENAAHPDLQDVGQHEPRRPAFSCQEARAHDRAAHGLATGDCNAHPLTDPAAETACGTT